MKKPDVTIIIKIPKENAKIIHERISVFLDKYIEEQKLQTKYFDRPFLNEFDIKALCYSCYTQGLSDAKEALNQTNLKNGK